MTAGTASRTAQRLAGGRRFGASCQGRASQTGCAEMIIWPGS